MKDGNISLLPWGRKKEQEGNLPLGGWARLDSINAVKIAVDAFMEKSHWFDYSGIGSARRIYVVTVEHEPMTRQIHESLAEGY